MLNGCRSLTDTMIELPKKLNRTEASVDGLVAKKLTTIMKNKNWALEVKLKKGSLKPHQKVALHQVEQGTFLYKIPDQGRRNPFDFIHLGDADAVVCWVDGKNVECDVNSGAIKHIFKI